VLSKHDDVVRVSKNAKLYCSGQGVRPNALVRSVVHMWVQDGAGSA